MAAPVAANSFVLLMFLIGSVDPSAKMLADVSEYFELLICMWIRMKPYNLCLEIKGNTNKIQWKTQQFELLAGIHLAAIWRRFGGDSAAIWRRFVAAGGWLLCQSVKCTK